LRNDLIIYFDHKPPLFSRIFLLWIGLIIVLGKSFISIVETNKPAAPSPRYLTKNIAAGIYSGIKIEAKTMDNFSLEVELINVSNIVCHIWSE